MENRPGIDMINLRHTHQTIGREKSQAATKAIRGPNRKQKAEDKSLTLKIGQAGGSLGG